MAFVASPQPDPIGPSGSAQRETTGFGGGALSTVPNSFSLRISPDPARPMLAVAGELDLGTAPRLREALRQVPEGVEVIQLDLSGVTFIDSTALGVLISAHKRYRLVGADLRIVSSSRVVAKVLEISGLRSLLSADDSPGQPTSRHSVP